MGMRVYQVAWESVTIGSAVQDLVSILAGAAQPVHLQHIHLEANVSAESALRMRLKRGTTTVSQGSGGSNITPIPTDDRDSASSSTSHINDTVQATTTGAFTTLSGFFWDLALPFDHLPPPEAREVCKASEILVLDLPATIAPTVISGFVKWSED